ncbi:MAG: hypothetical protein JSS29_00005 [Proteobacteria bacterium]|nr:hypothetical protein [Pseudomonadota bacterium]
MNRLTETEAEAVAAAQDVSRRAGLLHHLLLNIIALIVAAGGYVAHEHFKLAGEKTPALVALVVAAVCAFMPLRSLLGAVLSVERRALHAFHAVGALALAGLGAAGVYSSPGLMSHAAMAPFALMGAAQAVMHQDHPRNAEQAAALRRFASSLPEVAQFTSGDLTSPANAQRAVIVLTDLIGKAEALGETELRADPNFQSAWAQATTRAGLGLGLDSIDQAIDRLAKNPAAAGAVPQLRRELAHARDLARGRDR